MGGIRLLPVRLENFLLHSTRADKTQKIDRLFQMTAGDDHAGCSHGMKLGRGYAHLIEVCDREASESRCLIYIGRHDRGQRQQAAEGQLVPAAGEVAAPLGGMVHAGVIAAIADSACGYAALSVMRPFTIAWLARGETIVSTPLRTS